MHLASHALIVLFHSWPIGGSYGVGSYLKAKILLKFYNPNFHFDRYQDRV